MERQVSCTTLMFCDVALTNCLVYALDRLEHPSDDFARVQHKAEKLGSTFKYVHVDVTDEAGLKKAVSTIADTHHGIHGLIAAAGVQHELPALQFTAQQVNALLAINVTGVYTTTQAVAEAMIKYKIKGGSIALIASMSGTVANRNLLSAPYNISKAGVQQAGRSFAAELGPHGIRVNTISPGYVETEMVLGLFETHPERRTSWASQNCLGRIGKPEDLQGVAVYLMSDGSRWQTGSDVRVDGGHTAW